MVQKPLIGITLDSRPAGNYSSAPWYALRRNYSEMIESTGGLPVFLPYATDLIDSYLSVIQGLLVPGGYPDIDPKLYGEDFTHPSIETNPDRAHFELAIVKAALAKNVPILGICGGQQLLNVALGGNLIQHLPDESDDYLEHVQSHARDEPCHDITVVKGTLLHRILGAEQVSVNSVHHQAVRELGKGLIVNARAPDGVIEGIEAPEYTYCLGVQWHPEYAPTADNKAIFGSFLQAASK